ncbi:heparinase II/III family protein [Plantibacter sp. ME-Dv--P-122b]|uniref:heparinase II/III family protein n=1 Tax=Plantibacter sp. ME-Dv--P-122b TaxID=3040300 RepID=UPI00254BD941|nr:heparinase II/III family protein [Plantibacter sp. ME-Dv--P-122b]
MTLPVDTTAPTAQSFAGRFGPSARLALRVGGWRAGPPIGDRAAWDRVAERDRSALLDAARAWCAEADRTPPTLSLWARYSADGERTPYETAQQALLGAVASSALALGVTDDDDWAVELGDRIWRLCELTAWCLPSHYALPESGERPFLPVPGRDVLDLSDGYVGGMLAAIDTIAGDRLERLFPGLRARVHAEIRRRVLDPWRDEVDFWHGLDGPPNNWAPWIVSNVLVCSAVVETDVDALSASVDRALVILDRFRAGYAEDGSCDEGATYWWWAGATLFEALDLLGEVTDGGFDGFAVAPVAAMARFPMAMQLSAESQVNFSDGSANLPANATWNLLARFGERVGDEAVAAHARWMGRLHPLGFSGQLAPLFRRTLAELLDPGWTTSGDAAPGMPASWYAPGTEVAVFREAAGRVDGWAVAAKGGHNDVSHNHNDVGGVIVSLDGAPVLIDVGVGVYRRDTFMPDTRYGIWTMRSAFHNVPLPAGIEQPHGRRYEATGTRFSDEGSGASLAMSLQGAYPVEAGLTALGRTVTLDRADGAVVVEDAWTFAEASRMTLTLLTAVEPIVADDGILVGAARMETDTASFDAEVDRIEIDDPKLLEVWGPTVSRIRLVQRSTATSGAHALRLSRALSADRVGR